MVRVQFGPVADTQSFTNAVSVQQGSILTHVRTNTNVDRRKNHTDRQDVEFAVNQHLSRLVDYRQVDQDVRCEIRDPDIDQAKII